MIARRPGLSREDVALVLAALCAHAPALAAGFLWDDNLWLADNAVTRAGNGWLLAWTRGTHFDYYPLTSTAFWLAWRIFGDAPFGYHLVNLVLHATGALLLLRVLRSLALPGAWFGAALWAVHPVNVATVAWISEWKSTLSFPLHALAAFFWLTADETGGGRRRRIAIGLHAASLLAKASGAMLPIGLLLLAAARGRSVRREALRLAPMFAISLAAGLVTMRFQAEGAIGSGGRNAEALAARFAPAGHAVWFYLSKALVPLDLAGVYAKNEVAAGGSIAAFAAALGLIVALWAGRRRLGPAPFAAWTGYVVTLLPVLGFVELYYIRYARVADHWQYAALPWVLGGIAAGLALLAARLPASLRHGAAVACIAGLALLSFRHAQVYRDAGTFWAHVLSRDESSVLAHQELGAHLAKTGAADGARVHLQEAIRLDPGTAFAHANLGRLQEQVGDLAGAAASYRTAAELEPKLADARANLGRVLALGGDTAGAILELRRAGDLDPRFFEPQMNLGLLFQRMGQADSAEARFERVLAIAPGHGPAYLELARIRVAQGDLPGAAERLRELLRIDPDHSEARAVLTAIEQQLAPGR